VQFGSTAFHENALANLEEARRLTGVMCAVMVDTLGRELLIVNTKEDVNGAAKVIPVAQGTRVVLTADQSMPATPERLPVNHPQLASVVLAGDTMFVGRYLNTGADGCSLLLKVSRTQVARSSRAAAHKAEPCLAVGWVHHVVRVPVVTRPVCFQPQEGQRSTHKLPGNSN
jgi:pyruvate kinase